jgi:hypothetical protein
MNIDLLLYFSIICFVLATIGIILDIINWFNKVNDNDFKPNESPKPTADILNNTIKIYTANPTPKYQLNVSYIQFCREVVKWTAPIMKQYGIKKSPFVKIGYGKATKTMGRYTPSQNLVTVYLNSHDRTECKILIETLASSVLHECFHHIQSKTDPQFKILLNYKKYGYYNNRIERECREFENRYYAECIQDLILKRIIKKVR